MKTYHELFSELKYWNNYQPKNFSSSILKQCKLSDTKNLILQSQKWYQSSLTNSPKKLKNVAK